MMEDRVTTPWVASSETLDMEWQRPSDDWLGAQ
jgi:hypothetical protein